MMKRTILWTGAAGALAAMVFYPPFLAVLLILNLVVHLAVLGLQFVGSLLPAFRPRRARRLNGEPFVSIHVPAHNEPPELLALTLKSLARLRWENYEVLVIDNNTRDESVWRPIEALCEELGPRFRFFHVEGLKGFKAGALNYLQPHIDPRAEFVFVVDADYIVEPDALEEGLRHFSSPDVALVQFPQDYRNAGPGNIGLALDFKHFFTGYMNMANHLGCVPSTGTLSLIRLQPLRAVSGFATDVVTEDADLGLRLNRAGWRTLYVNRAVGHGLMPHDLEGLKKQRWRWAFGNAQILKLNGGRILFGRELSLRQKLGYLIHLTAWLNFNLLPSLTLILMAPLLLLGATHPVQPYLVVISGFTLVTFMVLRFGTLFYSLRREGHTPGEIGQAFLSHLGLSHISSTSWVKCLWNHHEPFVRTNKFLSGRVTGALRHALSEIAMGAFLLAACVLLTLADYVIGPISALLMTTARFLVLWVGRQTRYTLERTKRLQATAEAQDDSPQAQEQDPAGAERVPA